MESFVCVRPTGIPWSTTHAEWTRWTLSRFEREFDKWMRGRIPIINDSDVSEADIANHHLILFGDPNSNSVMAKLIDRVPVKWTDSKLEVASQEFDSNSHGLTLIYPNPLNPKKYVVINSGHTFHETEFKASNANLFPKLGDIAVIKFEKQGHDFREAIELADVFDAFWRLSR
ncbi:MAG: hypothetical protein FJ267_06555 [Planctomycetes bacterium]|nr:hypothetical protein [Planctomycetota bacterium]